MNRSSRSEIIMVLLVYDNFLSICKFVLVSTFWSYLTDCQGLIDTRLNKRQNATTTLPVTETRKWLLKFTKNGHKVFTQNPQLDYRLSDDSISENSTTRSRTSVDQFVNKNNEQLPSDSGKTQEMSRIDKQSNDRLAGPAFVHENRTQRESSDDEYDQENNQEYDNGEDESYTDEEASDPNDENDDYEITDYADSVYDDSDVYKDYKEQAKDSWPRVYNYSEEESDYSSVNRRHHDINLIDKVELPFSSAADAGINEIRHLPLGGKSSEPAINISLVVIYSWLGLVIIMIAITVLVFKYKQKLSSLCWRSTIHCRKVGQKESAVEEGNNLLTHPLM